jgi:hypothetical protein
VLAEVVSSTKHGGGVSLPVVQEEVGADEDLGLRLEALLEALPHIDHLIEVELGFRHRLAVGLGVVDFFLERERGHACYPFPKVGTSNHRDTFERNRDITIVRRSSVRRLHHRWRRLATVVPVAVTPLATRDASRRVAERLRQTPKGFAEAPKR